MDNQQIAYLLNIQRASRENRLVIFVGAGVSMNSSVPSWNQLINKMKAELPNEFSEETDALKIAQIYKDSHGHKEYMDKVKDILLYNKAVPNPLHKSILALNPCHIITTNYDDLIEQELSKEFLQYHIIREDKDITKMACPNTLVKMHGDYSTDNIVLTESDYFNYKNNFPLINAYVQSLFASKLVLFVGFSFTDLNLKMILNELQNILSENMQRAYLLSCEEPTFVNRQYFEKKGINILSLSIDDLDLLINNNYEKRNLKGIGLHTDKTLYAINNYSAISKKDLVQYLYDRIVPYMDEMRSFGEGLRYFFPKDEKMSWNVHSHGLETRLAYFEKLAEELKDKKSKIKFIKEHPSVNIRILLKIAYYNYLYQIDQVKIIDKNVLKSMEKYMETPVLYYIHRFDAKNVSDKIKQLRTRALSYSIEDLELPYTLFALGDAYEAYQEYMKLLPLYWNKQKYILYFLCRYNLWAIRNSTYFQFILDNKLDSEHDAEKEIEFATSTELDVILSKLPLPSEIKKIFQNMISYRFIGGKVLNAGELSEKIFQQRKNAERGGGSINSHIMRLMSIYNRESLFSWANYIIWDNNGYFKLISEYNALGILNSFTTPSSTQLGILVKNTRIKALNDNMIESLIFDVSYSRLREIFKWYEISSLKLDSKGIKYINDCLNGLSGKREQMFRDIEYLYSSLKKLLFLISMSKEEEIETDKIYKVVIKYQKNEIRCQLDSDIIENIIANYPLTEELAKKMILTLLHSTSSRHQYSQCIFNCVKFLQNKNIHFNEFVLEDIQNKAEVATEISFIYPIVSGELKEKIGKYSLGKIMYLYDYAFFIKTNKEIVSFDRFPELLEKEKFKLNCSICYILANIRKDSRFQLIHKYIDDIARENDCLTFYMSPFEYSEPEKVVIDWLLEYDDTEREKLFKISAYKETLKHFIIDGNISKSSKKYLMKYL